MFTSSRMTICAACAFALVTQPSCHSADRSSRDASSTNNRDAEVSVEVGVQAEVVTEAASVSPADTGGVPPDTDIATVDGGTPPTDVGVVGMMVSGIYQINELVRLEPSTTMPNASVLASAVIGLYSVEKVIRDDQGNYQVLTIAPPEVAGCRPFPISVAPFDGANHGKRDILVADGCADWVILDGGNSGPVVEGVRSRFAPPAPTAVILMMNTPGWGQVVASADNQSLGVQFNQVVTAGESPFATFVSSQSAQRGLQAPVTNVVVGWRWKNGDATGCLIQAPGRLLSCPDFSVSSGSGPGSSSEYWALSSPQPPYLRAFDAFDHLQALSLSGCGESLLGVGVFSPSSGSIPRKLQHITLTQAGKFNQSEVPTEFSVVTFAIIPTRDRSAIVGILGDNDGHTVFALAQVQDCGTWGVLGTWEADGQWRTPDAPQFLSFGPRIPMTAGIALAGFEAMVDGENGHVFLNYDGYTVRAWEFKLSSIGSKSPQPRSIVWTAHDNRTDLVFAP
jgi:hypothetical protein